MSGMMINVGSINVDEVFKVQEMVREGETITSYHYSKLPGGKGANQSVAIALAEGVVYHLGKVGADGKFLVDKMESKGVLTQHITISETIPTGRAIIQVNERGNNAIILHAGANHTISKDYITSKLELLKNEAKTTPYVLLQNEINDIPWIINCAKDRGLKICLNLAPCTLEARAYPLEMVDILVLNETEASGILQHFNKIPQSTGKGVVEDSKEQLQILAALFAKTEIIITLGEYGVVASFLGGKPDDDNTVGNERWIVEQKAFKVQMVDSTGAGDTFLGFFLAAVNQGTNKISALRQASAAAALAVGKVGAMDSIPTLKEVELFLNSNH